MKRYQQTAIVLFASLLFIAGAYSSLRLYSQSRQQPLTPTASADIPAVAPAPVPGVGAISGDPSHLTVARVNISLDVMPGYYNAHIQTWTSSVTKAVYAAVTTKPNNTAGDTFIYGHNRSSVFERLLQAKLGDQAVLGTSNGHTFTYKLVAIHDTEPTDLSPLHYQGAPRLTLQTCSGLFYQNRRMFVFNLEKAS